MRINIRSVNLCVLVLLALFFFIYPVTADTVRITQSKTSATIENVRIRIVYDLFKGKFNAYDKRANSICINRAATRMNDLSTDDPEFRRTIQSRTVTDSLGFGKTLIVRCTKPGEPILILEITVYAGQDFMVLTAGIVNGTKHEIRVRNIHPLADAEAFPNLSGKYNIKTLDAYGGSGETRVTDGPNRTSANNLLLTFATAGKRRSLVIGGLTYHDFNKYAYTGWSSLGNKGRKTELTSMLPGSKLAGYIDCGSDAGVLSDTVSIKVIQGEPWAWTDAESAFAHLGTVFFDNSDVIFEASGLDPLKAYTLGLSWWDFDSNGRMESVYALSPEGIKYPLIMNKALPNGDNNPEIQAVMIPREAYPTGRMKIVFSNDLPDLNAVVSEVWLWEFQTIPKIPDALLSGWQVIKPKVKKDSRIWVELSAKDPVGRLVDPGETYIPDDKFYVDFITPNPFDALELYGRRLRTAQKARPNPYDFPTVCAWYVGLFNYGAAQNRPELSRYLIATTPGIVEEMKYIVKTGFLNYSRAAVRLVPDKYAETEPSGQTEQGWWDDEHWQRYGHYVAPYETTKKYGEAIRALGGIPFTYFQTVKESPDFCQAHPEMMLERDPSKGLDYTSTATQSYLHKVYTNLRIGGVTGLMFDYTNDAWPTRCARGGFTDKHATAASVYRTIFKLAKDGLGQNSWVHERVLGDPLSDITAGIVDSQRTWGDTDRLNAEMVSKSGLRWYKNRVVFAYDMDAKDLMQGWKYPGFSGTDQDGRRMLLTMAYVAASRLLLATSFRDMPPNVLYDLKRTYPYHKMPQSARPIDAFTAPDWPRVYDFKVEDKWHQVTLYNNTEPSLKLKLTVPLSGDTASGALGLDHHQSYYAYDFWNDTYIGKLKGSDTLEQLLRPGEARMISIHQVENHPQFISTNRHIMQGYVDMIKRPKWNASSKTLVGTSRVVAGETYKVVIATNGYKALNVRTSSGNSRVELARRKQGLAVLCIDYSKNANVDWTMSFK